jgi:para-aminobenzoate synthetase component I
MTDRVTKKYQLPPGITNRLLNWAVGKEYFQYLNGNSLYSSSGFYGAFPQMLFAGNRGALHSRADSFEKLHVLLQRKQWLYGFMSYDLKNEIENLNSANATTIPVDHLAFVIPETIIRIEQESLIIESTADPDMIYREIIADHEANPATAAQISRLRSKTTKSEYIRNVEKIRSAIIEGEFYEMNYCIEYSAKATSFNPVVCYEKLNSLSPMPFSALMKTGHVWLICASPERFLKKIGDLVISQPIKGTIKRSFDKQEDDSLKKELFESEKERAENLMIVDLVRNDLARSAVTGSVKVEELFGIYTFKNIHQMISTVTSRRDEHCKIEDIIRYAFPMGSMTGAPKIRVMQEIDQLEDSSRGLYSGALGYFTPEGDFDFNVVIRSIIYDAYTGKLSFHVGSAITYDSDPEHEYKECLLKAETLFEVLTS